MDKWIRDLIDKYDEIVFENLYYTPYLALKRLPQGFRRFVSDHLFYYEKITSKALGESDYKFISVHRSTPFRFHADFYYGFLYIYVLVDSTKGKIFDQKLIGKFLISDFLNGFVSGQELEEIRSPKLEEIQSQDFEDQFEIPF